jgi:hypothetical protein
LTYVVAKVRITLRACGVWRGCNDRTAEDDDEDERRGAVK